MPRIIDGYREVRRHSSRNPGLLFWFVVVSAAEETAEESADTRKDFADSFSGFNDTVLNGLGKPESVERTERVRGGAGDEGFLECVLTGRICQDQALRVDANKFDTRRFREIHLVWIGRIQLCGLHHELGPDGQR